MNRLYTIAISLAITSGAITAQTRSNLNGNSNMAPTLDQPTYRPATGNDRAIIWSDDFSVASHWAMGHDGTQNLDWTIGTTVPTTGAHIAGIMSTTAANGFAMVNSDAFGNTTTNYEQSFLTNVTPVSCTGHPNVVLEFQTQYYKWTNEECYVVVQTTNNNWPVLDPTTNISTLTGVYRVWPGMQTQDHVDNPTIKHINISAVAGNQGTVYVRFYWSGIFGYQWYVDDVKIIDQSQIDATLYNAFMSETGTGEEYGRIPTGQLPANMNVGADLINTGVDTLTNPKIVMKVRNTSMSVVFSDSFSIASLAPGDTMLMNHNLPLPVLPVGAYTSTFIASSDQNATDGNLADNSHLRTFEVTDNIYALDEIGGHPAGYELLTSLGTASFTNAADGLIEFTYYPVLTTMTVTGIEFVLTSTSTSGGSVTVSLRDTANVIPPGNDVSTFIQTASHTISAYDVGVGTVGVAFNPPVVLQPGHYFAGVEMFSNSNANDFRILDDITVPQPTWASAIYDPGATPNPRVYSNGNAFAIRLTSNPNVGVTEHHDLQGVSLYPNPSTGAVTLYSSTVKNYLVEVINVMGETVMTNHINGTANMDLTSLAKGLYSVRVSDSKASMVQRLVLN